MRSAPHSAPKSMRVKSRVNCFTRASKFPFRREKLRCGIPNGFLASMPRRSSSERRWLRTLADYDWEKFIHEHVDVPQDELRLDVVSRLGYRLKDAGASRGT
jgi:hypothetical protein